MKTIVLAGTGTDVGKTHLAEALLQTPRPAGTLVVWKPYESGVEANVPSDSSRLAAAIETSGRTDTRLEPPLRRFQAPLAPPLAARLEGHPLAVDELRQSLAAFQADFLLVELAGGLFAPLAETWLGIDLVRHVSRATLVVVAPNRLGVLHDVLATVRAAAAEHVDVEAIVLLDQRTPDPSATHNAAMLRELLPNSIALHTVAHAPAAELAKSAEVQTLTAHLFT